MAENIVLNRRTYSTAEAAILSQRLISPASNPDVFVGTAAVFGSPSVRVPSRLRVVYGDSRWTISPSNAMRLGIRPLPTWFLKSVDNLVHLLDLEPGWNSHSAKPVARRNVETAFGVLVVLLDFNLPPPMVVPRVQGNIQLEWHTGNIDIEIYIDSPDSVYFYAEDIAEDLTSEGSLPDYGQELREWARALADD